MATFKIYRETALPGTPVNDSLYVVAPAGTPNYFELYVVNSTGSVRRIPTEADITSKINAALGAANELTVVADITARNALSPTRVMQVMVIDATADTSVVSGAATYLYDLANTTWIKVSEAESLDVVLNWSSIVGKPTSTAAAIDAAVSASHSHTNKSSLDKIGESAGGKLTYNGAEISTDWASTGW